MMASWISLFDRTLLTSIEAALLASLILILLTLVEKKLAATWRYSLWLILIFKLMLPWLPSDLVSELQWIRLPGVTTEHLLPLDRGELQTINPLSTTSIELDPPVSSSEREPGASYEANVLSTEDTVTQSVLKAAVILWLLGTVVTLLYLLIGYWRLSIALRREARIVVPTPLHEQFARTLSQCGISSRVGLRLTNLVSAPALFGIFSPTILIPQKLVGHLNVDEWDCVLRHELTHYKRKDVPVNLLAALVASAHWFNPFVWYSLHVMRIDQEAACDASVCDPQRAKKHMWLVSSKY